MINHRRGEVTERVAFGLGANLGSPLDALQGVVNALAADPGLRDVKASSVYRTRPVGGVEQPDFLNAVVIADTDLLPADLLTLAHRVEQLFGRTRDVRWGPRTLDVDVLALGHVVSDDPLIVLPHPRAHERAFVVVPWAEVDPQASVPGYGSVASLARALSPEDIADVIVIDSSLRVP